MTDWPTEDVTARADGIQGPPHLGAAFAPERLPMYEGSSGATALALLIDSDPTMRSQVRPILEAHGLEVVHARSSVAALELLQRMPDRFRLVLVSMEMPGLSGRVLLETLRLFRPQLPAICLTGAVGTAVGAAETNCLPKPLGAEDVHPRITQAMGGASTLVLGQPIASDAAARVRATFASSGSLLEAARELARALPGSTDDG
ncbi:MAG: response regulator [Gemmatimonadales bacterium]